MSVIYRYTGAGWFPGVPARDLTQADLDRLSEEQLAAVAGGRLYELASPTGPDPHRDEYQDELDLASSSPTQE